LGCRWNGVSTSVSGVDRLDEAVALITDAESASPHGVPGWGSLATRCAFVRTWGDCYGHLLVATGRAEIMVDPILSAWDASPFLPIIEEAGGRFTDLKGSATIHGGSALATNGRLHDEALTLLQNG
jgi:fructose-1,6-bisphosphatase/inositol monophosphatase family enzyme